MNHSDAEYLQITPGAEVYVRQILMYCQNQPWWHGYTVVPKNTIKAVGAAILSLGSKSLGSFLYDHTESISRSPIEFALIYPEQLFYTMACPTALRSQKPIVTRRSIFYLNHDYPLSVTESFLSPAMDASMNPIANDYA